MPYIAHSVKDNIPNFVQYNYPLFVELMNVYYDYLYNISDVREHNEYHKYINGDINTNNFIEKLMEDIGIKIPIHPSITNKLLIIQYLNTIIKKRGTESSLKAFFKLAFNEDISITYPHKLLMISSITQHDILNTCLLKSSKKPEGNFYSLKGFSSNTIGDIEKYSFFKKDNDYYIYIEFKSHGYLKIDERVDIMGNTETLTCVNEGVFICDIKDGGKLFEKGDILTFNDCFIQGEYEVIELNEDGLSINIIDGGENYAIGDIILSNPNNGFFAKVSSVNELGSILTVSIFNDGSNFTSMPSLKIYTKKGKNAKLEPFSNLSGGIKQLKTLQAAILPNSNNHTIYSDKGVMTNVELMKVAQVKHNNFVTNNHKMAINNFILDSNNIHNHSYNIITSIDLKYWKKYIDKYFHRSGYVFNHINPIVIKPTPLNYKLYSKVI